MRDVLATTCAGSRRGLFGLALRTGILTILTLGLYGFWAGARLRRWHWSAIRPGGHPLDHDGDAGDRIAGFLFAVAILALWVTGAGLLDMVMRPGAVQAGIAIGLALLVPVGFWARDRQRAATLSQTSWRGIRFGMVPGAAGHAWRS